MVETPFYMDFRPGEARTYSPGSFGFVTEHILACFPGLKVPEINSAFTPVWWYENTDLTRILPTPEGVFAAPGADADPSDLEGRALPLWFKADTGPGRFKLTLTLCAGDKGGEVMVFVSRRRLAWLGALGAGNVRTVDVLCDVSPVIAVGGGDAAQSDKGRAEDISVDLAVIGAGIGAGIAELRIERWDGPAAFIMGDSTVTDRPAAYPYAPGVNYCGWGQMLQTYLGNSFVVSNHAYSGLSTETFRDKGHYDVMRPLVRPGDMVLIQFGHNDQKKKHLAASAGYTDNLIRYIEELRALGAVPVLVTSLARNTWRSEMEYNDLLLDHANAAIEVGRLTGAPVAGLHELMKSVIISAGMDRARQWYHTGDYAHPNDFGAYMAAGFVAGELVNFAMIPAFDAPTFPVRPPLAGPEWPSEGKWHGNAPPQQEPELVDYGMIPDFPWQIT